MKPWPTHARLIPYKSIGGGWDRQKLEVRQACWQRSISGKLTTFTLGPEGTLSAASPTVSVDDGPFQAHVEAESFDGRMSRSVSNTITLQRDDSVPTVNNPIPGPTPHPGPFPGGMHPGMGRPPGMPSNPGFPGLQPGRHGFGGRGMRR